MIDIAGLLRPVTKSNVSGIEELAARLAAGADVPPEEVMVVLDRTHCDIDALQAAVDRHERVLAMRRQLAEIEPLRKRLAAIESEVTAADAEVFKVRKKLDAVVARTAEEQLDLRCRVEAADRAKVELIALENLPPAEAERLRIARHAADVADEDATNARRELDDCKRRLQFAEDDLPAAERDAKASRTNADAQAAAERIRSAIQARGERVAEAEKNAQLAEAALGAARRERAAVEIAVARSAGVS
jgi:hypothetical protein